MKIKKKKKKKFKKKIKSKIKIKKYPSKKSANVIRPRANNDNSCGVIRGTPLSQISSGRQRRPESEAMLMLRCRASCWMDTNEPIMPARRNALNPRAIRVTFSWKMIRVTEIIDNTKCIRVAMYAQHTAVQQDEMSAVQRHCRRTDSIHLLYA